MDVAEIIEEGYKELYSDTVAYSEKIIQEGKQKGYVTGAFGLKLRTPSFKSKDKQVVSGEERTANNMVTQSYGMLTNRACIDFQEAIEQDDKVSDVILINQIHDAIYGLVKATPENVHWVNQNLIKCMCKDFIPDQPIPLGAELDIGTSWKDVVTIPNDISLDNITILVDVLKDGTIGNAKEFMDSL